MGHLQILLISLLNQTVLYQKEFSQLSEVPVKHLITQRKNYYRLVEACQKVLKETTGDTRTIYSFLAFRLLHEGAESVEKKHERIFGDPYNFKDRELILILNPLYYKSLLPKDFQAITDRDVMREKLLPYGRTFQQLVKNAHDRAYKKYRFPLSPDAIKPIVSFVSCLNILRANTENICAESHRAPVNLAHELTYLPDTEQHIRQYVGKDIKQWIATNSIFELDPSKIQFVEYVGSFED